MNEGEYKTRVTRRLKAMFPGCEIIKTDSAHHQGVPDLFILWGPFWASLEFKKSKRSSVRPNQNYFVHKLNEMSFAAFIYPENEEEVLYALEQAFKPPRRTCISESEPVPLDPLYSK